MSRVLFSCILIAGFSGAAIADEVTYRKDVQPLFEQKCAKCHGEKSPALAEFKLDEQKFKKAMKGPRMDSYDAMIGFVGWPDTGAIARRLDDGKSAKDGKKGNMYTYLGKTEEERQKNLAVFKDWVGGDDAWRLNRFKAKGDVPGITKEEMEKIKVKY